METKSLRLKRQPKVWNFISSWEIGRERIYDNDQIVRREEIKAEAEAKDQT